MPARAGASEKHAMPALHAPATCHRASAPTGPWTSIYPTGQAKAGRPPARWLRCARSALERAPPPPAAAPRPGQRPAGPGRSSACVLCSKTGRKQCMAAHASPLLSLLSTLAASSPAPGPTPNPAAQSKASLRPHLHGSSPKHCVALRCSPRAHIPCRAPAHRSSTGLTQALGGQPCRPPAPPHLHGLGRLRPRLEQVPDALVVDLQHAHAAHDVCVCVWEGQCSIVNSTARPAPE